MRITINEDKPGFSTVSDERLTSIGHPERPFHLVRAMSVIRYFFRRKIKTATQFWLVSKRDESSVSDENFIRL